MGGRWGSEVGRNCPRQLSLGAARAGFGRCRNSVSIMQKTPGLTTRTLTLCVPKVGLWAGDPALMNQGHQKQA